MAESSFDRARWDKHVYPHGPLTSLGPDLWQVTGSLGRNPLPRNMVAYRLPTGKLWLHSVIALSEECMGALEALGGPAVIVVPNGLHRADAAVYKDRYPDVQVLCPESSRSKVEQVVAVDDTCENVLPDMGIQCHAPSGLKPAELCYELTLEDGKALVFCDCLFNIPEHRPGFGGWVLKMMGSTGVWGITNIARFFMLKDKEAYRGWLQQMADLPDLEVLCVAHGTAIRSECAQKLREAADAV